MTIDPARTTLPGRMIASLRATVADEIAKSIRWAAKNANEGSYSAPASHAPFSDEEF